MNGVQTFEALKGRRMDETRPELVVVKEKVFQVSDGRQSVGADALDRILLQVKQDEISRESEGNRGQVVVGQLQILQTVQMADDREREFISYSSIVTEI